MIQNNDNDLHLVHKKAIRFGIGLGTSVGILGVLLYGVLFYYHDKIYPYVVIRDVYVGGMRVEQAEQAVLNAYSGQMVVLKVLDREYKALPEKLGVHIQATKAVEEAFLVGRNGTFNRTIDLQVNLNHSTLKTFLSTNYPEIEKEPSNAEYQLVGKLVSIKPSEVGATFNIPLIAEKIQRSIVDKQKTAVSAVISELNPEIDDNTLAILKPSAENFINSVPTVMVEKRSYKLLPEQKINFLNPAVVDGQVVLGVKDEEVKNYITDLSKRTSITAQPALYYDSGELSEEGRDGRSVDIDLASQELKSALTANKKEPLILSYTSIPKSKKIIPKPYTGGLFEGKYVEIDLSSQRLFQFEGANLIATRKVSTGKWSTPTPIGTFSINSKHPRAFSRTYKLYMPYWMAFIGTEYGLHELPEWPDGRKEGASHLGTAVSHGCIRLGPGAAQEVYDWADIGTKVVIHK